MRVEVTSGTITERYLQATDITKIDSTSKVFFLEESEYEIPEILFGDGKVGKDLLNGDVISVSYSTSSGTGANGLKVFENIGTFRDNLGNSITSGITTTATSFPDGGSRADSGFFGSRLNRVTCPQSRDPRWNLHSVMNMTYFRYWFWIIADLRVEPRAETRRTKTR